VKANLENFKPKLRNGRVIPQGSRIIFETDNPYNQVILPTALADLVLLCSGQFSVREIVEKIYKKQGLVPFKSILTAIHVLHQGAFFENGEELELSSDLQSWMKPKRSRWNLSWTFGQRIVADNRSPMIYYAVTLFILITAMMGTQMFPSSPFVLVERWSALYSKWNCFWNLAVASSLIMTLKHALRGFQLLMLTGKAYNVSIRLSPWGLYLHIGNEANDLFENRLYTAMFYVSQIFVPWSLVWIGSFMTGPGQLEPFVIMALLNTFWNLNPFVRSDGLRLIQALFLPMDRDVASWHFEFNQLIDSISPVQRQQDKDFARMCAIWGAVWLVGATMILHESAIAFGPGVLSKISLLSTDSLTPLAGLFLWLFALYMTVQALIETVAVSLVRSTWRKMSARLKKIRHDAKRDWNPDAITLQLESLPLFSHFHDQYLKKIIDASQVLEFSANSTILAQGDPARELFVLLDGEIEIIRTLRNRDRVWITRLGAISVFGEAALVDDQPRSAQVQAYVKSTCLRVPIHVIRQAATDSKAVRELEDFRNAILVNQFFASNPVFRSLSRESIDFLSSRGTLEYFDQDQTIFQQGDLGDSLFLILRGAVAIKVHDTRIKSLPQGDFFGEISMIADIPRTATVTTLEPTIFFKISSDAFWEVLVKHMDLGVFLETISENRLREDLEIVPMKKTGTDS
jgi:CRP-like cAMP-binding protein